MNNSDNVLEPVGKSAYVYQLPIRIWHWTMVACVSVLIVTGYIIGKPWLSVTGQPYDTFYMGYTRMAHFIAGFILIISTVLRWNWSSCRSGVNPGGAACGATSAGISSWTRSPGSMWDTIPWPRRAWPWAWSSC